MDPLRQHALERLQGGTAFAPPHVILQDVPPEARGVRPDGLPYSAWELLEHLRFTQHDILAFSTAATYAQPDWPDDYWPADAPAPPSDGAWHTSRDVFLGDLDALRDLVRDEDHDLLAPVPAGDGQTLLREVLLAAEHNAYHLGQMVTVLRLLDAWDPPGAP